MYASFDGANTHYPMKFRADLAQKQFKTLKRLNPSTTYEAIGAAAKLSPSTVWDICSGKGNPGDPNVSTVVSLFKSLGLKPEYALNFQLRKSEIHLAQLNGD